jgi:hypothetical protein
MPMLAFGPVGGIVGHAVVGVSALVHVSPSRLKQETFVIQRRISATAAWPEGNIKSLNLLAFSAV